MSDWFRGVIEGAYVGQAASVRAPSAPLDVTPFDIRLFRASISAVEVLDSDAAPSPASAGEPTTPDANSNAASAAATHALHQAELRDVVFIGVGDKFAEDHHAAFDLRITDVELVGSTEHEGKIYGRLVGNVIGRITPPRPIEKGAVEKRKRARRLAESVRVWVESLRWVMVAVVAWTCFGLCGAATGTLWLVLVLPAAMFYGLSRHLVPRVHGLRVLGWLVVLAGGGLATLLQYRRMRDDSSSVRWWLAGLAGAMFVSALVPSRYPFLWTKVILAGSLLSLCGDRAAPCEEQAVKPSVINQGPRLGPDGRWPRSPSANADQ
jgi:hypothetical protein